MCRSSIVVTPGPLWTLPQLQELFDEWVVAGFTDWSIRIIGLTC
jgi:hypothetical protein